MILLILLVLLVLIFWVEQTKEQFTVTVGEHCVNCFKKSIDRCLDCDNCGLCLDNFGNYQCVPGNPRGAYDASCRIWYHRDPFSYKLKRDRRRQRCLGIHLPKDFT